MPSFGKRETAVDTAGYLMRDARCAGWTRGQLPAEPTGARRSELLHNHFPQSSTPSRFRFDSRGSLADLEPARAAMLATPDPFVGQQVRTTASRDYRQPLCPTERHLGWSG